MTSAAARAEDLGAARVGTIGETVVVLRSPGGFTFCLTTWHGDRDQVREGVPDLVDQVCLDIPEQGYAGEATFWHDLTGWEWAASAEPELSFLRRPAGIPLRILFQRLGEPTGRVRAHADIATVDRAVTRARHLRPGPASSASGSSGPS